MTIDSKILRHTQRLRRLDEILEAYFDKLSYLHQHRGEVSGVSSGFSDLDRLTGGFQGSDLIILAARRGVGKTTMALCLAQAAAQQGKNVALFSLQLTTEQLIQRLLTMETGIAPHRLRLGRISDEERATVTRASEKLRQSKTQIFAQDGELDFQSFLAKLRHFNNNQELDLVVVDSLHRIHSGIALADDHSRLDQLARDLKILAREIDVPILINVDLPDFFGQRVSSVPQLSDLEEVTSAGMFADLVMFLHRSDLYDPEADMKGLAELYVARHRNGPTGLVNVAFIQPGGFYADLSVSP